MTPRTTGSGGAPPRAVGRPRRRGVVSARSGWRVNTAKSVIDRFRA
ncbi:hypothetical protein ACFV2U_17740 [Streptomyces sp. NPDC059697]